MSVFLHSCLHPVQLANSNAASPGIQPVQMGGPNQSLLLARALACWCPCCPDTLFFCAFSLSHTFLLLILLVFFTPFLAQLWLLSVLSGYCLYGSISLHLLYCMSLNLSHNFHLCINNGIVFFSSLHTYVKSVMVSHWCSRSPVVAPTSAELV